MIAECPLLDEDRRNLDMTNAKLETMVKNPEASRKLLMTRFPGLQVRDENSIEAGGGDIPSNRTVLNFLAVGC